MNKLNTISIDALNKAADALEHVVGIYRESIAGDDQWHDEHHENLLCIEVGLRDRGAELIRLVESPIGHELTNARHTIEDMVYDGGLQATVNAFVGDEIPNEDRQEIIGGFYRALVVLGVRLRQEHTPGDVYSALEAAYAAA